MAVIFEADGAGEVKEEDMKEALSRFGVTHMDWSSPAAKLGFVCFESPEAAAEAAYAARLGLEAGGRPLKRCEVIVSAEFDDYVAALSAKPARECVLRPRTLRMNPHLEPSHRLRRAGPRPSTTMRCHRCRTALTGVSLRSWLAATRSEIALSPTASTASRGTHGGRARAAEPPSDGRIRRGFTR